jgi:hypothetical protein
MEQVRTRVFRFGAFELDARAGELRKHGVKLRLQEQPFRILLMLLENPGEVVLREEIRKRLWPNDTIVEFDHSINAAIKRLRQTRGTAELGAAALRLPLMYARHRAIARRGLRRDRAATVLIGGESECRVSLELAPGVAPDGIVGLDLCRGASTARGSAGNDARVRIRSGD